MSRSVFARPTTQVVRPPSTRKTAGGDSRDIWSALTVWSVLGTIGALLSMNPVFTLAAVWVVPVFAMLLWREGESPVLFFVLMFQWAEVGTKAFHANVIGVPLHQMSLGASPLWSSPDSNVETAAWLSLAGLVVLAAGMRAASWGMRGRSFVDWRRYAQYAPIKKIWTLYLLAWGVAVLSKGAIWIEPGLTQPLLAFMQVKWVFFFMFAVLVIAARHGYGLLAIALVFETIVGLTGFFADFTKVYFVLVIALATVPGTFRRHLVLKVVTLGLALVLLGSVWSAIKPEYRTFLNQSAAEQEVPVEFGERLSVVATMLLDFDRAALTTGFGQLAERVAYIDYFARVMDNVPRYVAHEYGNLTLRAISHVLMPRLLFPNKSSVSDSAQVVHYARTPVASGTSVSLGYMTEFYIDFGPWGMYLAIFGLGAVWGLLYRYFLTRAELPIEGYALAVAVLIFTGSFGTALTKVFGGAITSFLAMMVIMYLVLPRVRRWLYEPNQRVK